MLGRYNAVPEGFGGDTQLFLDEIQELQNRRVCQSGSDGLSVFHLRGEVEVCELDVAS